MINETKTTEKDKYKIQNYHIIRNDRTAHGGGVAIFIHQKIPFIKITTPLTSIEILSIKLSDNTVLIAAYNNPRNNFTNTYLAKLFSVGNKIFLVGDLNARHREWKNHRNNTNGNTLLTFSQHNNLNIVNTETHTHYPESGAIPTYIDLIVNKNTQCLSNPISLAQLTSHHNPVLFSIGNRLPNTEPRKVRSYKNTNLEKFRTTLDKQITINKQINSCKILDIEVANLTNSIQNAINSHTTQIVTNDHYDQITPEIKENIRERNKKRKQWQANRDDSIKNDMKQLTNKIRQKINEIKNEKWTNFLQSIHPQDKSLWRLTKNLTKKRQPIKIIHLTKRTYFTDKEKADLLANTYEKIQTNNIKTDIEDSKCRYSHTNK